jgi:hypothetical protein
VRQKCLGRPLNRSLEPTVAHHDNIEGQRPVLSWVSSFANQPSEQPGSRHSFARVNNRIASIWTASIIILFTHPVSIQVVLFSAGSSATCTPLTARVVPNHFLHPGQRNHPAPNGDRGPAAIQQQAHPEHAVDVLRHWGHTMATGAAVPARI